MKLLEDRIFALLLGKVVEARGAFLARRERLGLLFAKEIFFLAETVQAPAVAVVGWGGRRWSEVEGFVFYALCEELFGCVGGVRAGEQLLADVWFRGCCHGGWMVLRPGSCASWL